MEALVNILQGLTIWHWLGVGIVLLTLEVAVGTFDLLWIALGAFLTALFALVAPVAGWQGQLVFFGFAALALVAAGRTVFKGLRNPASTHPNLNDRTANMIGHRGLAATAFIAGSGKVKVDDTVWLAEQVAGSAIAEGDEVVVAGADGTTLKVKPA